MKVLLVNSDDNKGGAAIAALRLHKSLLNQDINSQMIVQGKHTDLSTIIGPANNLKKLINLTRSSLDQLFISSYKNKSKTLFSPAKLPFSNIVSKINKINPDIVHLHWINGGMMRIEELSKIKAPIVWSLHDMWPFTGGCHYNEDCNNFKLNCGNCKILGSGMKKDLSSVVFKRKYKTLKKIDNLTIVGLSNWISEQARASSLFKNYNVVNIPNLIDINTYYPLNTEFSKEALNLPVNKKIVMFGAMSATSDPRKGFEYIEKAIRLIYDEKTDFAIFGSTEKKFKKLNESINIHSLGNLQDDLSLKIAYNAADVIIVPSIQENFSNVILESLSCGTPVVAFNIGGNPDMITHKKNGYLVKPYDHFDLAQGVKWVLANSSNNQLQKQARKKVKNEFSNFKVTKRYVSLYESILGIGK